MSNTTGRRKLIGVSAPCHIILLLLTATARTVHGRPNYAFWHFGRSDANGMMRSNLERVSNHHCAQRLYRDHRIFRRGVKYLDFDYPQIKGHEEDDQKDVVDREDHVTQYLSELLVNTDSEITGLQASEVDPPAEQSGPKKNITLEKFTPDRAVRGVTASLSGEYDLFLLPPQDR
ncbi:hypothetical protein evm_005879 [Chilo suppressalis]|nr:hypothetical protein evm_005879 [Chilo suppressalis]